MHRRGHKVLLVTRMFCVLGMGSEPAINFDVGCLLVALSPSVPHRTVTLTIGLIYVCLFGMLSLGPAHGPYFSKHLTLSHGCTLLSSA
jgi:hypothetical protein